TDRVLVVQQRCAVGVEDVERAAARDETGEPAAGRGDVADHPLARAVEDVEVIGHEASDLLQHQGVLAALLQKSLSLSMLGGDWTDGTMTDFKWRHFQGDVILWAVRWYCRYPISYRDLEEMLAERGISVDHTTIYRWVQC